MRRTRWALALLLVGAACATALKEPPPLSALQGEGAGIGPADALLQDAAAEFDTYLKLAPDGEFAAQAKALVAQLPKK